MSAPAGILASALVCAGCGASPALDDPYPFRCPNAGGHNDTDHVLRRRLDIAPGQTTPDGKFTLTTVECLGDCENAPCLMVNFDYYGNVDPDAVDRLLDGLG